MRHSVHVHITWISMGPDILEPLVFQLQKVTHFSSSVHHPHHTRLRRKAHIQQFINFSASGGIGKGRGRKAKKEMVRLEGWGRKGI